MSESKNSAISRRSFVKQGSAGLAATAAAANLGLLTTGAYAQAGNQELRLGVVGAGGRGSGAVGNCLQAAEELGIPMKLTAVADLAPERVADSTKALGEAWGPKNRFDVKPDRQFSGMDAYKKLCSNPDVDVVVQATPPGLRYLTLREAVNNGKHSFVEKPVCVDADTYHHVLASGNIAKNKGLAIVSGTQYRRENSYKDAIDQLQNGIIGDIMASYQYYCGGTLWHRGKGTPPWTPMEYQMRNWLYFTWLSGDLIAEQSIHNIDAINWSMDANPVKAYASGGRISRTDAAFGNVYDHFDVHFEYANGIRSSFMGRQYQGATNKVENRWVGTKGELYLKPNPGRTAWIAKTHDGQIVKRNTGRRGNNQPYVEEHKELLKGIVDGKPVMEIQEVADSSMTCILGREAAYSGKELTFDYLVKSNLKLRPGGIDANGPQPGPVNLPFPDVRRPGSYKI